MKYKLQLLFFILLFLVVPTVVCDKLLTCPTPRVRKRTIIQSNESLRNGARLIGKVKVNTAKDCYESCCRNLSCNVAIMHYKEERNYYNEVITVKWCFLFSCGSPSVCTYEYHRRYAIIDLGPQRDVGVGRNNGDGDDDDDEPSAQTTVPRPEPSTIYTTKATATKATPTKTTIIPTTIMPKATTAKVHVTGESKDFCKLVCGYEYEPVCGDDDKTYSNMCVFRLSRCKHPSLKVAYDGECGGVCRTKLSTIPKGVIGAYIPQCKTDGTYKEKQCHASTGYCWCVDPANGNELKGTKKGSSEGEVKCGVGACRTKLATVQNGGLGAPTPQCKPDGSYQEKQCHASTGYCWCVEPETGNEIKGTKKGPTEGDVTCGVGGSQSHNEQSVTVTETDYEEQPDESLSHGTGTPPQLGGDPYYSPERRKWLNGSGAGIVGDCHAKKFTAPRGLVGVHIPQCNADGTYKEKQCHSSTGYCWCVELETGKEIKGTKKGPTEGEVTCGSISNAPPVIVVVKENALG